MTEQNYTFSKRAKAITVSDQAYELIKHKFKGLDYEALWAIYVNKKNKPIDAVLISIGCLDKVLIDRRRIVKRALELNATGVIMVHNHLSGDSRPSTADISETEDFKKCCELFDISLIDHIIISDEEYFSFADSKVTKTCMESNQ